MSELAAIEDESRVTVIVDLEGDDALVKVVDANVAHDVTMELLARYPDRPVMQLGGIAIQAENIDGRD